jgi:hypothetical protein
MVGRKAGGISGIAVRQETLEIQGMTRKDARTIVNKAVKLISAWEAKDRFSKTEQEKQKLEELEMAVCTHYMAKAMRITARPNSDIPMSQAEAGAVIFVTAKSWQRWENKTSPISLKDICHFLLATNQLSPFLKHSV